MATACPGCDLITVRAHSSVLYFAGSHTPLPASHCMASCTHSSSNRRDHARQLGATLRIPPSHIHLLHGILHLSAHCSRDPAAYIRILQLCDPPLPGLFLFSYFSSIFLPICSYFSPAAHVILHVILLLHGILPLTSSYFSMGSCSLHQTIPNLGSVYALRASCGILCPPSYSSALAT